MRSFFFVGLHNDDPLPCMTYLAFSAVVAIRLIPGYIQCWTCLQLNRIVATKSRRRTVVEIIAISRSRYTGLRQHGSARFAALSTQACVRWKTVTRQTTGQF